MLRKRWIHFLGRALLALSFKRGYKGCQEYLIVGKKPYTVSKGLMEPLMQEDAADWMHKEELYTYVGSVLA